MPANNNQQQVARQIAPVPDALKVLFRREVANLLSLPPHVSDVDEDGNPVQVVVRAAIERLSSDGQQQSVQLCSAGDQSWITRTEGARAYFPVAARISKRARAAEDDDAEPVPVAVKAAAKKRKGAAGNKGAEAPPATPDMAGAKKRATPKAPKKAKKQPAIFEDDEGSPAARAGVETHAELRKRVNEALGRGGPNTRAKTAVVVKEENLDEHELASLCGKVSGLDVKSAIDADSVYSASRAGSVQLPIAGPSICLA